jgi:hypothetical protein
MNRRAFISQVVAALVAPHLPALPASTGMRASQFIDVDVELCAPGETTLEFLLRQYERYYGMRPHERSGDYIGLCLTADYYDAVMHAALYGDPAAAEPRGLLTFRQET